jgi:soluble lytic murein transglycosylase-like protein
MRGKVFQGPHPDLVLLGFAALLLACVPAAGQVRVETDSKGTPMVTNKGAAPPASNDAPAKGKSSKKSRPGSAERATIEGKLRDACNRRGLDYRLISCLVEAESGFNHFTVSHKGAVGLMQLMPDTAKRFGCNDPWDLDQNIEGGTRFLEFLNGLFAGEIPLILAGYNAGENSVMRYSRKIPPYAETVRYVFTILNRYGSKSLVEDAREALASPDDYNRYYMAYRDFKVPTHTYYMYIDERGARCFTDTPPSHVDFHLVVYKDD